MTAADPVVALSHALLYEGYALYPYRKSSLKNAQRWFFGGVYPPAWSAANPGDAAAVGAELLLEPARGAEATVELQVRFLHFCREDGGAEEREVTLDAAGSMQRGFAFGPLRGEIELRVAPAESLRCVTLAVRNVSTTGADGREAVLPSTMACLHAVLRARDGAWISLLEPPAGHASRAAACRQQGLYPVLVGTAPARETLLAAPIALYDYPRVAPESKVDLFDATEIDEILTLRVQTLTDAEKAELAGDDARVRDLLARVEALTPPELLDLHGAIRDRLPGSAATSPPAGIAPGARVRLKPRPRGDVFDLALAGRAATVASVERDVDGGVHLAVVVDDDPGADLGAAGFHGHRFFFSAAEVELL